MIHEIPMVEHLLAAFALTYALGFERAIRGAAAGDRTFSLIGVGAAVVAALSQNGAPTILTGVITGVGFIGGGLTFRQSQAGGEGDIVRGITTAATIFAAAAIGAAAGEGLLLLAATGTALALLTLEIRHIPLLRLLDGRRWAVRYREDAEDIDDEPCALPDAPQLTAADEKLLDTALHPAGAGPRGS
jgi:putative Mg2+ transporter-C (MgtC) family protein